MSNCPNMCFRNNAHEIADILNEYPNIEQEDLQTAIIGLSRIVSSLEGQITDLKKEITKLKS